MMPESENNENEISEDEFKNTEHISK